MGPHLPNGFQQARSRLVDVTVDLLVKPEVFPEKWDPAWGKRGDFNCYQLDVSASAHFNRKDVTTHTYLGCSWEKTDDVKFWIKGDCHGYLPQMTKEALQELLKELPEGSPLVTEIENAVTALRWLMSASHAEQQRIYEPAMIGADKCYYMTADQLAA